MPNYQLLNKVECILDPRIFILNTERVMEGYGDFRSILIFTTFLRIAAIFANLFKCYTGAGLLSLPFAFRYSGVVVSLYHHFVKKICSNS